MLVLVIACAVVAWLIVLLFVVSLCKMAARSDEDTQRHLAELRQDRHALP